jgi:hypothetical protein
VREAGETTAILAVTPVAVSAENSHEPAVAPGIALLKLVKPPVSVIGYTIERYVLAAILPGFDTVAGAVINHFVLSVPVPSITSDTPVEVFAANIDHPVPKATEPLVAV